MDEETLEFIRSCRRAVLGTIAPDGRPRLVPVCFALAYRSGQLVVHSPLDEKPKRSGDVRALARVTDVLERPDVSILFDRWSEDWSELAWVRLDGHASLLEPEGDALSEHRAAVERLRDRYPPYRDQRIVRLPMIRIAIAGHRRWGAITRRNALERT